MEWHYTNFSEVFPSTLDTFPIYPILQQLYGIPLYHHLFNQSLAEV